MKMVKLLALVLFMCAFVGCKPDLVVKNVGVTWDDTHKKATAEIVNIGSANAGEFMVYFNAEEDPVSPNYRPQVRHRVDGLARGTSLILEADFAPLARPENNYLGNVYKILVLVDPKNMVDEIREDNNQMTMSITMPSTGCVDFEQQTLNTVHHVGNQFIDSGVQITIQSFQWDNGQWTNGGHAEIGNLLRAGHMGQEIAVNNVNLQFKFGGPLERLSLFFGEHGGNLNIRVNGDFRNFANFANINAATIGGVTVSVVNGHGHDKGSLELSGTIDSFEIGGQELWIDHVCP
ncbi:hypothetical protein KAX97_05955 [candidate division WOR-3 bacterium]|nr:hypothetical protein [candidate division WOR-3 bacterium]